MVKCPGCGHEFLNQLSCTRCGHKWMPRSDELPVVCPNPGCKSPYWNKPYAKRMKRKGKK